MEYIYYNIFLKGNIDMKIAFFDSGVGGLTVLNEALQQMPDENYIYYADTENAPYGIKTRDSVRELIFKAADEISRMGIKALVIACNTATSIAIKDLREKYDFPIIGMEPAVKPAVELNGRQKRIFVAATPLTLKEERFKDLVSKLDKDHIVDSIPLSRLVEFCENDIFDRDIIIPYLKDQFSSLSLENCSTLVLGCTHFPFYKDYFKQIFPAGTSIIDGNSGTVKRLQYILDKLPAEGKNKIHGSIEFYSSGRKLNSTNRFIDYLKRLNGET